MLITTDSTDPDDMHATIDVLTRLLAARPAAAEPGSSAPTVTPWPSPSKAAELKRAVLDTLAGYGDVRLPIVKAIAEASPDALSRTDTYVLACAARPHNSPERVVGGLRSSIERGWASRTKGQFGAFITTSAAGYHQEESLAAVVLEVLRELGH